MNIYKVLNEITKYIDDNLEEEINYDVLARMMGVNTYTMQRMFSLLTNVSVAEYIRKRKLSVAGFDLYNSDDKIMDVAVKYGYDNATSFSRAFEAFHGIKPSMVNKQTTLKEFPRIVFDENIKVTETMEYEIVELEEMNLCGMHVVTSNQTIAKDAPKFFKEFEDKYRNIYGDVQYGMVTYIMPERECCDKYYVLYDKDISVFEKINIPAGKWLKFRINSQVANEIQEMSHKFYIDFLPSCKYNLREVPELEYYHDGVTDFLVPIY